MYIFRHEQNFRIEVIFASLVFFLCFYFQVTVLEWLLLLGVSVFVLVLEIVNTAIEYCVDLMKPRLSEHVQVVKDMMAGAVLLASLFAVILGICIFLPYIQENFI